MGGRRSLWLLAPIACVLLLAPIAAGSAAARSSSVQGVTRAGRAAQAQLVPAWFHPFSAGFSVPFRSRGPRRFEGPSSSAAPAATLAPSAASATAPPVVGLSFAGLDSSDGLAEPPDPQVAVGNGFVVEAVNAVLRVWTTTGTPLATYQSQPFFLTTGFPSDPRILWDAGSARWYATVMDPDASAIKVAVSKSADPTQGWWIYTTPLGLCADQPSLAVSAGLVIVGYNGYSSCDDSGGFVGSSYFVWNQGEILTGGTAHYTFWQPLTIFGVIGVRDSAGVPEAIAVGDGTLAIVTFSGLPTAGANATASTIFVGVSSFTDPPGGQQLGTTALIDANDSRMQQALASNGTIWVAGDNSCVPSGSNAERSCLRLIHVSQSGQLLSDQSIGIAGADLYYPALETDPSGDLLIAYGVSSASSFPSMAALVLGPDGTLSPSVLVAAGKAPHFHDRYGDYFGAAADPDHPFSIWVAGEIGQTVLGEDWDWGTAVARLDLNSTGPPPPQPQPPPRDTTPPHVRALQSQGVRGHVADLDYRVSDDSGRTREQITVYSKSRQLTKFGTTLSTSKYGVTYYATWRVPLHPVAPLKFCVQSWDPSGNRSARSCARFTVR